MIIKLGFSVLHEAISIIKNLSNIFYTMERNSMYQTGDEANLVNWRSCMNYNETFRMKKYIVVLQFIFFNIMKCM